MTNEELSKRIDRLEYLANQIIKNDRYLITKNLDLFNVSLGVTTSSKISFHGVTPVAQAGAISTPGTDGASLKTAVDAIRTVLINLVITA